MEFGWPRAAEQAIPRLGADSHHAGEAGFEVAKINRPGQRHDVSAERPHDGAVVRAWVYCDDEEDGGTREWRRHGLRNHPRFNSGFRSSHGNCNSIERIHLSPPQRISRRLGVTPIVSLSLSKPRTNLLSR